MTDWQIIFILNQFIHWFSSIQSRSIDYFQFSSSERYCENEHMNSLTMDNSVRTDIDLHHFHHNFMKIKIMIKNNNQSGRESSILLHFFYTNINYHYWNIKRKKKFECIRIIIIINKWYGLMKKNEEKGKKNWWGDLIVSI